MYETMAREAGAEARLQGQRAELIGEQLAGYDDATEDALAEAAEQERALSALVERVAEALPGLADADAEVDAARATERLAAEREALSGLSAPDGLVGLADRVRETSSALAAARDRLGAAERSDTGARERLAAAPDREPLLRLRRDHAELADLDGQLPGLEDAWRHERARTEAAAVAASEAETGLEQARAARDEAVAGRERLRGEASRLADEWAALTSLRVPDGVVELDAHRAAAAEELAGARRELAAAEATDAEARDALATAPDRAWLEQVRRDHIELLTAERAWRSVSARHEAAAARAAEASTTLADGERALAVARIERDMVARSDLVAALRPSLAPHQPCPVCEQPVTTLPPPADGADLSEANAVVRRADERRDQAAAAQRSAAEAEHRAAAEVQALTVRIDSLRARLSDAPALLEEVDARLAEADRLSEAARAADDRLRRARRAVGEAEATDAEAARRLASAGAELRAARDPLVALGAPALDPDEPVGSWRALTEWATGAAAERAGRLTETERAAADAERAHAEAARALAAATERAERRRAAHTEAVRAEQDAGGELARAGRRHDELARALADTPPDDELARRLAELDRLDAEVQAADADLRSARAALREAREAAAEVSGRVERGWRALRAARDPLVGLGAPMLDAPVESDDPDDQDDPDEDSDDPDGPGDHLVAAWHTLVGWARRAAIDRERRLRVAQDELADARRRLDDTHRSLVAELAGHGVTLAGDRSAVTAAAPAASAALERARAATARLAERKDAAATLAADRDDAERARQVARMLAGLLRSDAFPRWLVASALDALVADASRNLTELSGGQFELAHSDGEFLVVDHADADASRPVKTLSGGETFQASLALALALSEQLATLAAAGAARLDSIFLDEGFGTLDEANLEVVAGTLENLATLGDRMVGVVTHVPALAERVPVRFAVGRDQHTASVTREAL
jgi:exonuclease SbcC